MIDLNSDVSSERSLPMEPKAKKHENKLPPSMATFMNKQEKGSVQAPLSKYPGRKTPLTKKV